jgi:hypothetical protein
MNAYRFALPSLLAATLLPTLAVAQLHVYSAVPLLGTEQSPPVSGSAYGALTAVYDELSNTLHYQVEWEFPDGLQATAAHFHGPAGQGGNAPPVLDLGAVSGHSGKVRGSQVLSTAEEAQLLSGQWYVNVHSTANPDGEIRGQVLEYSPLDNSAVYLGSEGKLRLEAVMVPGLGVFDAELEFAGDDARFLLSLSSARVTTTDDRGGELENETEFEVENESEHGPEHEAGDDNPN